MVSSGEDQQTEKPSEVNLSDFHCTIQEATEEIRCRREHPALLRTVEQHLGSRFPSFFNDGPKALYFPPVVSPNTWLHHVNETAEQMGLSPICFECTGDKFCSDNYTKLHLGYLRFFHRRDRNGLAITTRMPIVDMNAAGGRRFKEIHTLWGEELVSFHHRLTATIFPDIEVSDMSEWAESWGGVEAYYDAYLSLCVGHCVLFESFLMNSYERDFTENVFIPAFKRVTERFGFKPLIVPLEPIEGPIDLYWYSYPESIKPLVLGAMSGVRQ
ncbi:MAG: hypothetical protein WCG03_04295 [Kiritimatiellales bacterium]